MGQIGQKWEIGEGGKNGGKWGKVRKRGKESEGVVGGRGPETCLESMYFLEYKSAKIIDSTLIKHDDTDTA